MGTVSVVGRASRAGLNGAATLSRDERILHFQDLVKAQARRLHKSSFSHVPLDDLIQQGQLGLIKAVDAYNPEKAGTLSLKVYCIFSIRQSIVDAHRRRHYRNDTAEGIDEDGRSETPDLEKSILQSERRELIRKAYLLLPERSRIALETHRSDELLHAAAEKLNLSESAVCLLRQQARREFAHLLSLSGVDVRGV